MGEENTVGIIDIDALCSALGEIFRLCPDMAVLGDHFQDTISETFTDYDIPVEADWDGNTPRFSKTV